MQSLIDDISLSQQGAEKMPWFKGKMPIITQLNAEFKAQRSFNGLVIAACFHLEPKTAYWIEGFLAGGAEHIYLVGNLGTTKPETAAWLATRDRVTVLGKKDDTYEDHLRYLSLVMENKVDLFLDNGASLILAHHRLQPGWKPLGANEETRSGRILIEQEGFEPDYPVIVIDDSPVKWIMENKLGVGQSVVDGFMRATSLLVGGKNILVIGYGHCGSGVAQKFRSLGANTMVYDIEPVLLLQAKLEGNRVDELEALLPQADVVITVTGQFNVITAAHIPLFKPGAILCNAGHYCFEIDRKGIVDCATSTHRIRNGVEKIDFGDRFVYLLQNANPLNLSAADGNPIEIMDMGLGLQASCARHIASGANNLVNGLQVVPDYINDEICRASLKL